MLAHAKANADLDALYGSGTPATMYCALFTAAPAADGTGGTEVSGVGTGYARQAVTNNATNFPAAVAGVKSNGTAIVWPVATGAGYGTVTHGMWLDALSAGNRFDWAELVTPRTINATDQFTIAAGQFVVSM
jgi:hypothetical protein